MKSLIRKIAKKVWYKIKRSDGYAAYWSGAAKFWDLSKFDYKVVNLGSGSAVHAFNYGNRTDCINWAIAPQSLAHDFNVLKNYFSYLAEGATVFIPLCPFSCLVSKYSKEQNLKYYTFLHPATIFDFDENERVKALRKKEYGRKAVVKHIVKYFFSNKKKCIKRFFKAVNFKKDALVWVNNWKTQFQIEDLNTPLRKEHVDERKLRQDLLCEMVSFCLERNLRPILVMPPLHRELRALFTSAFVKNYVDDFVFPVLADGVEFWNYSSNNLFDNDKYFDNSFYLSKKGAVLFTNTLIERLKKV